MQFIKYIILFYSFSSVAQIPVTAKFINKEELKAELIIDIDNFNSEYHIYNNTLSIQKNNKTHNYSNIQLGEITSVNTYNSLKINVFYKNFNSVVILDNRLTEIVNINFNTLQPFRDITNVSTGYDNTIWIFNQNTQQLELFDYITNKTKTKTLPVNSNIIDMYSNYNYCWLLTGSFIYAYNYIGSLIYKLPNNGYTSLKVNHGNLYLLKKNQLFFKAKSTSEIQEIKLPKLLIKQFFVTNETLYIYDGEFLYHYQLITN